jgi:hypothetical protein
MFQEEKTFNASLGHARMRIPRKSVILWLSKNICLAPLLVTMVCHPFVRRELKGCETMTTHIFR